MPLFESQEARNKRLFNDEFEALYNLVSQLSPDDSDRRLHAAWLLGGWSAAQIALAVPSLEKAWGKGDRTKARALMEIFVLAMMSWWYRQLDKSQQRSEGERRTARVVAASNILMLFENYSEEAVAEVMNMDIQFNWDLDQNERQAGRLWLFGHFLMSKALEACDQPSRLSLRSLTLPCTRFEDVLAQGGSLDSWNPYEAVALQSAVTEGARNMFHCHETWPASAQVK